jgi:hypothetical protein
MRAALLSIVLTFTLTFVSPVTAQTAGLELQAGLGYARAFDGGGVSFAAGIENPLSSSTSRLQHALGAGIWYSEMSIASAPGTSNQRHLTGLGMRYQVALRAGRVRPYLAVPVQVLRSNIPDRTDIVSGSLSVSSVPDMGAPTPVEDRVGSAWGWGAGLELGFRLGLSPQLSAQTAVQSLYQRIYESGTRNGAWTIHGGFTYQP